MSSQFALLSLALTACADAPAPLAGVRPGDTSESSPPAQGPTLLDEPAVRSIHEAQVPSAGVAAPAEPEPEPVAPRGPQAARIRELEASRAAYLALPPQSRTALATEVYRLELLELGQALLSAAGRSKYDALGLRTRAKFVLEELSFDAGEDSDFGLRAYQLLADLHRANGNEEEATTFDDAIDRVLKER